MESDFSSWYGGIDGKDKLPLIQHVFNDTLEAFSSELSRDQKTPDWLLDRQYANMEEVLVVITDARGHYENHKGQSATRDVLVNLTEKMHHYSGIMDVMVQHHPEYASLAWGAMKVLFTGVVNHQNTITRLAWGLSRIADILPRTELLLQLYPTNYGKKVITDIYVHILKFLMRALDWYCEGKMKHLLHSITKPPELQYDDLLNEITALSGRMTEFALASSHAEQRDMHGRQKEMHSEQHDMHTALQEQTRLQNRFQMSVDHLTELILQMKESMAGEQVINASARIELRQQLSQIQLVQFLEQIKANGLEDPIKVLQSALFMHRRTQRRSSRKSPPIWFNKKVQDWNSSHKSSLIIIKGTWKLRIHVQGFCIDSIASLRDSQVPVFWALNTLVAKQGNRTADQASTIDVLKYLIAQAVSINKTIHTDAALTPWLGSSLCTKTEEQWMDLLMWALQGLPMVYIVLDTEVLSRSLSSLTENFWPTAFLRGFSELSARNIRTIVKVLMVSYGSETFERQLDGQLQELVVPVGNARQSRGSGRVSFPRSRIHARGYTAGASRTRGFDGRLP